VLPSRAMAVAAEPWLAGSTIVSNVAKRKIRDRICFTLNRFRTDAF
jgi:hypothetical protein